MRKIVLSILFLFSLFAVDNTHMQTKDKALQEALNGNYSKAFKMFKDRCDNKKDGYACGMVGYFYNKGFSVKVDKRKAVEYYTKGYKLNDGDSCALLGYYYYKGIVVPQNSEKARAIFKKGCKLKNRASCQYLTKVK